MKKIMVLALAVFLFPKIAFSYETTLCDESALAYSKTFVLDNSLHNSERLSAQVTYTSATVPAVTFSDGIRSTGSITVNTLAALTTAYASNTLTVGAVTGLTGAQIVFPGIILTQGKDWSVKTTTILTAIDIARAIRAKVDWLTVSTTGARVDMTAKIPGAYYNSIPFSSKNANLTAGSSYFTGGQDNAAVTINGISVIAGQDWFAGATPTTAGTSIAAAINGSAALSALVTATANSPSPGIVALAAKAAGTGSNYGLVSSTPAALTMSGTVMTGGASSTYSLGSPLINIPAHGLSTALPILYSGTPAIGGLTSGTTYYPIKVDSDYIELAATSTGAIAGAYITITSSAVPTSLATYTLAPLAITGTPSFKFETSDDGVGYADVNVSSVTMSAYTLGGTASVWDFGYFNTKFLRLNVIGPTRGGISIKAIVVGKP